MRARATVLLLTASTALFGLAGTAFAHEGEEDLSARTFVQQAIAIMRGQPEQVDAIEDKIADALEAEDSEGVGLDLVRQAQTAFEDGRMHEALDLLELSVGAAPHRVVASPNAGIRSPAPLTSPPPVAPILHERAAGGGYGAPEGLAGPLLLAAAGLLILLGTVVVRRAH